jgi:triosephosphate isomerase
MNLRYRKTVIAGNWKMNKSPAEARKFVLDLKQEAAAASKWCDVVLCVPFLHIPAAVKAAKGTKIAVGAQNCHFEETGAFTGEISCRMLAEAGCKYVIVGHSERRRDFGESDRTVNRKVLAACEAGLRPIVCVGETLDMPPLRHRLRAIWAIGTGKTATAEQARRSARASAPWCAKCTAPARPERSASSTAAA